MVQAEVVVCVRVPDFALGGTPAELVATYGTTTPDLLGLRDWLAGLGVTEVAGCPSWSHPRRT